MKYVLLPPLSLSPTPSWKLSEKARTALHFFFCWSDFTNPLISMMMLLYIKFVLNRLGPEGFPVVLNFLDISSDT